MHLIRPTVHCDNPCEMLSHQGSLLATRCPKFLMGSWSYRYPLPNTYQNSRLSEEKEMFDINHIVYINGLGIVNNSYWL